MTLPAIILASLFFTFFPAVGDVNLDNTPIKSVEIGIAEVSPLGESGGYAVPASGCSNPVYVCTQFMGGNCESGYWDCPYVPEPIEPGNCSVSPTSATIGQSVTWTAVPPTGGSSSVTPTYTYAWSGTDSLSGTTKNVTKTYSTTGVKSGQVTITSSALANPATYSCTNTVTVGEEEEGGDLDLTLQVAKIGTTNWRNSVTLTPEETAKIRWTTTDAEACTVVAPAHNLQVAPANGVWAEDVTVDEPAAGSIYSYTARCTRGSNEVSRTVYVTVEDDEDNNETEIEGKIEPCDDIYVTRQGEEIDLCYETNNPPQCVIRLGGVDILAPLSATSGQFTWTLNSQGVFVLYCAGVETDRATIRVLPEFQET